MASPWRRHRQKILRSEGFSAKEARAYSTVPFRVLDKSTGKRHVHRGLSMVRKAKKRGTFVSNPSDVWSAWRDIISEDSPSPRGGTHRTRDASGKLIGKGNVARQRARYKAKQDRKKERKKAEPIGEVFYNESTRKYEYRLY